MKAFAGEMSIGLLASRVAFEGPLVRDKASFLIAGRRTYADLLIRPFQSRSKRTSGFFDDVNVKANLIASSRDRLHLSLFSSRDGIEVYRDEAPRHSGKINEFEVDLGWANQLASLRWNRLMGKRLFGSFVTALVGYRYNTKYQFAEGNRAGAIARATHEWSNKITDWTSRIDVEYARSHTHNWRFGGQAILHHFLPGRSQTRVREPDAPPFSLIQTPRGALNSLELAAYAEDELQLHPALKVSAGVRVSAFSAERVRHQALTPRIAVSWRFRAPSAVKASGMYASQYMHLVTGGGTALPADLWIPVQRGIPPQRGFQVAAGAAHSIDNKDVELSVEVFAKRMRGLLEYQEGARSYSSAVVDWPDLLEVGRGSAYGLELFAQKRKGSLQGWVGYTWARSTRQFAELNGGDAFPDGFDRRHDLSIVGQFWLSARTHFSAAWVYGSGYPVWVPAGTYYTTPNRYTGVGSFYDPDFEPFLDWGPVNSGRAPDYHRLDLSIHFSKKTKRRQRVLAIGLYNAYNRKNPMYVFPEYKLTSEGLPSEGSGYRAQYKQISVLQLVPAVSWQLTY